MKPSTVLIALTMAWILCIGFVLPTLVSARSTFVVLIGISILGGLIAATYYGARAISENRK